MQQNYSQKFESQTSNNINKLKIEILKASSYIKVNHKLFCNIITQAYIAIDILCQDYPTHLDWYWSKVVPNIFNGTRDIFIATINQQVAGVILLKKEGTIKKVCTLFVLEKYRRQKIATILLEEAFKYLGTTKPLFSIRDYKLNQFSSIIHKYNWKQTQILSNYYKAGTQEIVFNGKIL